MPQESTTTYERELSSRIRFARDSGDECSLASALQDRALIQTAEKRFDDAFSSLEEAYALHESAGRRKEAAEVLFGIGKLQQLQDGETGETTQRIALSLFEEIEDQEGTIRVLKSLASSALSKGDLDGCERETRRVQQLSLGDRATWRESTQLLAFVQQSRGDSPGAMKLLREAMEDAKREGAEREAESIELSSIGLRALSNDTPLAKNELDMAIQRMEQSSGGVNPPSAYFRLQRAALSLAAQDVDAALLDSEEARKVALDQVDPLLYLLACIGLAQAREVKGDDMGVLDILHTCRVSLGDLLGEEAGFPVLQIIRSCHLRWGDKRYNLALQAYRAQFDQ